jgi:outer membrane protein
MNPVRLMLLSALLLCGTILPLTGSTAQERQWDGKSGGSPADHSLSIEGVPGLSAELGKMARDHDPSFVAPSKVYSLPELIDLAQRHNRTTRVAWEKASQAAAQVGITAAQLYPMLSVVSSYGGGYWNQQFNSSSLNVKQVGLVVPILLPDEAWGGYSALQEGVKLRYTLFDFGQRVSLRDSAKRSQLAANLSFNATHQQVTYEVTQAYYTLETDRKLIEAAEISVKSAADILASTQAKYDQGLTTEPALLQAKQAKAQADFDLLGAVANRDIARLALLQAIGADPSAPLSVSQADFSKLGKGLLSPLDQFVKATLDRKPDLLSKVADAQAALSSLKAAKVSGLPQFSLQGGQDYYHFNTSAQGPGFSVSSIGMGIMNFSGTVNVEWPAFDGGLTRNKILSAQATWKGAAEAVLLAREQALSDVARAYTNARTAIARKQSAEALETASQASYESLKASYDLGRTSIQDVLTARTSYAQAVAAKAQCDAAIAASLATLTYQSGQL